MTNSAASSRSTPPNPDKSAFTITINPASIDTNNQKRDEHLRGPDFLNVKQFAAMKFKSTAVRPINGGYSVTGDFTMCMV